jgi:5-methylcytosine-specific restriction enzyme A
MLRTMRRRRPDPDHPAYDPGATGPDGLPHCRRCLAQLRPGQREFCSATCRHEALMRLSPGYARAQVFARDDGVCCQCRLDCGRLDRVLRHLVHAGGEDDDDGLAAALTVLEALGLGRRRRLISTWQMDHRTAVAEGGADCGLGNYRTLCLRCHARATRDLHRRLSGGGDESW